MGSIFTYGDEKKIHQAHQTEQIIAPRWESEFPWGNGWQHWVSQISQEKYFNAMKVPIVREQL